VLGKNYKPVASKSALVKDADLLPELNKKESGEWIKVYEAGYLGKDKVEVHYFLNKKNR
jgi:hypothetical protein